MTSLLPRPQHPTKTLLLINIIPHFDYSFCLSCHVWLTLFALGVVADVCCWFFFVWDCCWSFFLHMLVIYSGVFYLWLCDPHPLTCTHLPTLRGFWADAHHLTLKCWWVVSGVGWTTFRDSPYESDFILVTQVRAIMCCLLILFITQSGSCILWPPCLLLCCFPLHRRQISSDTTSSLVSSTATKHKLLKD